MLKQKGKEKQKRSKVKKALYRSRVNRHGCAYCLEVEQLTKGGRAASRDVSGYSCHI
jgi:hypothetical protein